MGESFVRQERRKGKRKGRKEERLVEGWVPIMRGKGEKKQNYESMILSYIIQRNHISAIQESQFCGVMFFQPQLHNESMILMYLI